MHFYPPTCTITRHFTLGGEDSISGECFGLSREFEPSSGCFPHCFVNILWAWFLNLPIVYFSSERIKAPRLHAGEGNPFVKRYKLPVSLRAAAVHVCQIFFSA
jgi:hypothetical protein